LQPLQVVFAQGPHRELTSIDGKDKFCLSGELSSTAYQENYYCNM